MGINSVSGNPSAQNTYYTQGAGSKSVVEEMADKLDEAGSKTEKAVADRRDGFVRSTDQPDVDEIRALRASMKNNIGAFQRMVQNTAVGQNSQLKQLFKDVFANGDDSVKLLGDDPYWGIEATATRLADFAKTLSGGDPDKADALMEAVEKGFKAAEKVLGGLPEISKKTLERTRELFEEWKNSKNPSAVAEEG